jgi:hypothetical protein
MTLVDRVFLSIYYHHMDISVEVGKKLLRNCDIIKFRGRVQVLVHNQWLHLCRTDLKDDVCTFSHEESSDLEAVRIKYLEKIVLGVRISPTTFAVIDSYTDG